MKTKPKIHFRRAGFCYFTACGLSLYYFYLDKKYAVETTANPKKVTCKNCKKSRMFRLHRRLLELLERKRYV